jgi:hypothetical protein
MGRLPRFTAPRRRVAIEIHEREENTAAKKRHGCRKRADAMDVWAGGTSRPEGSAVA